MSDKQSIDAPHGAASFQAHGHLDVVTLGDFTIGRGVFEPGWRWSNDVSPSPAPTPARPTTREFDCPGG